VWDYGFIPEAAPTAAPHFIADSDNFFMLEPQKRATGEDMVRLGWIAVEDVSRNLSKWTTKEQRECGKQLLFIHARELPAHTDEVIAESRAYMAKVYDHLDPTPQPHIGHGWLGPWFEGAKGRMRGRRQERGTSIEPPVVPAGPPNHSTHMTGARRFAIAALGHGYDMLFGRLPDVNRHHPLWMDAHAVAEHIDRWEANGARVLWLSAVDSFFHSRLENRVDPLSLLVRTGSAPLAPGAAPYDACLCELRFEDLPSLRELYVRLRPMLRDGGDIVVYVFNESGAKLKANDITFCDSALPDVDQSVILFFGSRPALPPWRCAGSTSRRRARCRTIHWRGAC
jgi:hypothetical protein